MGKTDETAKHAVTVEAVREISMPWPANDVALVPITARLRIEQRPEPLAIKLGVGRRVGRAEELPEIRIVGKSAQAGQFQLEKRKMRLIEIDRVNLGRARHQIGQRIATARGNRDDGRADGQAKRGEIGDRVFPYLGIDQTTEPERVQPVPDGCVLVAFTLANDVCDDLAVHPNLESTIRSGYRALDSVLRQQPRKR